MSTYRLMVNKACEQCGEVFRPWVDGTRYCSMSCKARAATPGIAERRRILCLSGTWVMPARTRDAVLAILAATADRDLPWVTLSDLALLIYGEDDPAERHAIRMAFVRLRTRGYVIESRPVPWGQQLQGRGYRLVSTPAAVGRTA